LGLTTVPAHWRDVEAAAELTAFLTRRSLARNRVGVFYGHFSFSFAKREKLWGVMAGQGFRNFSAGIQNHIQSKLGLTLFCVYW
jgi:hypothetical protein